MKRFFFTVIAFAAVTVGCTKSSILEKAPAFETPIEFQTYTGKTPVSKATETNLASVQAEGFHVTAFLTGAHNNYANHYLNADVTYVTEDEDGNALTTPKWDYPGVAYWPDGSALDFVAYGLNPTTTANVTNGSTTASTNLVNFGTSKTTFTYSVPDRVADQYDLVVAVPVTNRTNAGTTTGTYNNTVTFDFKHVLSKVGFKVQTDNDYSTNPVNVIIKNITIKGVFKNTGIVNLTSATPAIDYSASTSTIGSYSLFDHNYTKGTTTGNFSGFVCQNSTSATPIYPNTTYAAGDLTTDPTASGTANVNDRFMMIMPGTVGTPSGKEWPYIEVVYELTEGEEQVAEVPLKMDMGADANPRYVNWKFEAGYSYEFVLKVSTSAIGFTVTVSGWTDYFAGTSATDDEIFTLTPLS